MSTLFGRRPGGHRTVPVVAVVHGPARSAPPSAARPRVSVKRSLLTGLWDLLRWQSGRGSPVAMAVSIEGGARRYAFGRVRRHECLPMICLHAVSIG